jgi:hypothetical protein
MTTLTAAQTLAAIADVQTREGIRDDRSHENDHCDGRDEWVLSERDGDVAAGREENRRWRQWP